MTDTPISSRPGSSGEETDGTADAARAATAHAPGAVPATEGVPPRTGTPANPDGPERSASEDLADALDLLRRAARKSLHAVDPRIEQLAERAVMQLRELDEQALHEFSAGRARFQDLEQAAQQAGRDVLATLERVVEGVDRILRDSSKDR